MSLRGDEQIEGLPGNVRIPALLRPFLPIHKSAVCSVCNVVKGVVVRDVAVGTVGNGRLAHDNYRARDTGSIQLRDISAASELGTIYLHERVIVATSIVRRKRGDCICKEHQIGGCVLREKPSLSRYVSVYA